MIIGITGKYCAGKDIVSQLLVRQGFNEINLDKLGHIVLEKKKQEVIDIFGNEILDKSGKINRKALGKMVFSKKEKLKKLESILHPEMIKMTYELSSKNNKIIINAAILFQLGLNSKCDLIIIVTAPFIIRLKRAKKRDNLSIINAIKRLLSQKQIHPKSIPCNADIYYIKNNMSKKNLTQKVISILNKKGMGY